MFPPLQWTPPLIKMFRIFRSHFELLNGIDAQTKTSMLESMQPMSRRHFLKGTIVSVTASHFPAVLKGAAADRKLKLGLIGAGWYGMVDVKDALKAGGVALVGVCDVDTEHLAR